MVLPDGVWTKTASPCPTSYMITSSGLVLKYSRKNKEDFNGQIVSTAITQSHLLRLLRQTAISAHPNNQTTNNQPDGFGTAVQAPGMVSIQVAVQASPVAAKSAGKLKIQPQSGIRKLKGTTANPHKNKNWVSGTPVRFAMGPIQANSPKYQARMGYNPICTTMETLMNWMSFPNHRSCQA